MSQDIGARVEIEALRGEFIDAGMIRDYDRFASLFTQDAVWRIPVVNVEFVGRRSAPGSSGSTAQTPSGSRSRAGRKQRRRSSHVAFALS